MKLEKGMIIYFSELGLCHIDKIDIKREEIFEKKKVGFLKYEKISTGKFDERIDTVWISPVGDYTGLSQGYWYDHLDWKTMRLNAIRILNQIKHL